jgi:hypothetical protein
MPAPERTLPGHRRQPSHPGPAQQTEKQRFRLVVPVLGGQQHFIGLSGFDERPISRIPRRTLKAGAGFNLNMHNLQWHTQRITDRLTMFRPRISRSLKAVMDMEG